MTGGEGVRLWRDRLKAEVGQIWAEAYVIYKSGEELMLPDDLDRQARAYADNFNDIMGDPLRDYLDEWLAIPLPVDWDTYEPKRRLDYYRHYDELSPEGAVVRDSIALCEIVATCPWPGISRYSPQRIGAILKSLGWEKVKGQKRVVSYRGKDGKNKKATFYQKLQNVNDDEI